MELRYIRDTDRREVDFVVLRDRKPEFAVECKLSAKHLDTSLRYFRDRTKIDRFYQVHLGKENFSSASKDIRVLPFTTFCQETKMP